MKSTDQISGCGLIILAGGHSSRMGYPKAFLEVNGQTFVEHICKAYEGLTTDNVIVLNAAFAGKEWQHFISRTPLSMSYIINNDPSGDRIHSLTLGARAISTNKVFVHNIDQPFVSTLVLEQMKARTTSNDILVPTFHGRSGHPVVLGKNVLDDLRKHTHTGIHLNSFYQYYTKEYYEVSDASILQNMNTVDDLDRYKSRCTTA